MRNGLRLASAACGALLAAVTCASKVQASPIDGVSSPPKLPVVKVLGCRLNGIGIVCGPGPLLPKRLRKREHYYKEEVEPSNGQNGQSAKTPSSKGGTASKNEGSHRRNQGVSDQNTAKGSTVHPATEEENAGVHACPPGDVVLDKPDANGSFCQPVPTSGATTSPSATPQGTTTSASSGAATTPSSPSGTTGTPAVAPSNGGTTALGTAPAAPMPTQSSGSFCCSAPTTSNGQPAGSLQACGTDQSSALTAIVSAAAQKDVTLGDVQCGAH